MHALLFTIARRTATAAVVCLVLALGARTLVVSDLVTPIEVRGSSMAPTLQGEHWELTCRRCGRTTAIGADLQPGPPAASCVACGAELPGKAVRWRPGDTLWIDRTRSEPRRWDVVVLRCPHDASALCVKRVVGLPGETLTLADGDLFAGGGRLSKPPARRLELRRLEHEESVANARWSPDGAGWRLSGALWVGESHDDASPTLRYDRPVYDDLPANAGVSRRFNQTHDLMLDARFDHSPDACWTLVLPGGEATIDCRQQTATLRAGGHETRTTLPSGRVEQAVFANFDRRLTLTVDDAPVGELPFEELPANVLPMLAVHNGVVRCDHLRLYKDVYYEGRPHGGSDAGDQPWTLGPAQYFLLGDNQAVSVDSRTWDAGAGVPARLILGVALPDAISRVKGR